MNSKPFSKLWAWVIGICSILLILACILPLALGTGGLILARQAITGSLPESKGLPAGMTAHTAVLQNLQGWVEVERSKGDWAPAAPGQLVLAGQSIRTGKLSSVSLAFMDGSQALLKAGSELVIDVLDAPANGQQRRIIMTQFAGESTHQVVPNHRRGSRYEVHTSAGVGESRGTEFQVVVTAQQTVYYYVSDGLVAVSALNTTVLVNPGFMTVLYTNQPPLAPVQTLSVEGLASQTGSQWTVAGTTFNASEKTVVVGDPQAGDWVQVRGHLDESGQNLADWVILLRRTVTNRFSLTGTVEAIAADQWQVDGQAILVAETTGLDQAIQVGDRVFVKGLVETGGALRAVQIERLDEELGQPFTFTGVVQVIDGSLWNISDVAITTDDTTELSAELVAGDLVTVKGRIQSDGAWLAKSIILAIAEDSDFAFTGELESMDPWAVAGIRFETRGDTLIQAGLQPGDRVRVEGSIDPDGVWIATKIELIDAEADAKMILIGTVITIDPWVVNGITLTLAPGAVIGEQISAGMLVQVEMVLQPDGSWQVIKIEALDQLVWLPGCMDVIATVVSVNGNQLQLLNWPAVTIPEGTPVEGTLAPNSIIRMRVCFDQAMLIQVTSIVIIQVDIPELPGSDDGGKVTVCHKPGGKKGGHTLSISSSALPAHLGHGDYAGACR